MARTARTRKTGLNAAAWFAAQSFHYNATLARVAAPAPVAPALQDLFGPATSADTRFYAGLLVEALETRAALETELADEALVAARDEEHEAHWRAEREGDACGQACGFCGRCA